MYKFIEKCRACGNAVANLIPVFDLGVQPLANDFKKSDEERSGYAPLKVLFCEKCTLAQLSVVVNPELLYSKYPYVTSRSKTMMAHFELLWQAINIECNPESVVEIGSNDGFFLEFCKANGAGQCCGIDPASNLASVSPVASVVGPFNSDTAFHARSIVPNPSVVIARHVFAHIDDWQRFIRDLDSLCSKETMVVIEVPYAVDTLKKCELDQVYHEHLSFVTIKSLEHLLLDSPFRIYHVIRFPIHGDSVVIMLNRRELAVTRGSVSDLWNQESVKVQDWLTFSNESRRRIDHLGSSVRVLLEHRNVSGYGASAKSTVWINACGFSQKQIQFVTDTTPSKIGRLIPGTDIPVVEESAIKSDHPDYMICFAWNFKAEILDKEREYVSNGGRFIFPHEL